MGGADLGFEVDVLAQVKAVGHVIRIGADIGMARKLLGPLPFLLQVVVEAIGVLHAFHVAARAGVAVPIPSATDAIAALETAGGEALFAGAVQKIEARETGAHNHDVNRGRPFCFVRHATLFINLAAGSVLMGSGGMARL